MEDTIYLLPGTITVQQLAEWFGISYSTFRKQSKKRYKELRSYCQYNIPKRGYIEIQQVYHSVYIKDQNQYSLIKKYTQQYWKTETFETAIRVAIKIKNNCPDVTVSQNTCARYVARAREELWPRDHYGERGGSYKEWVKTYRFGEDRKYEQFTPEDKEIRSKIRAKYFPQLPDGVKDSLLSDYFKKKISADEYIKQSNGKITQDKFLEYQRELAIELNCDYLTKATYVKDGVYYVIEIAEDGTAYRREILLQADGAFVNLPLA